MSNSTIADNKPKVKITFIAHAVSHHRNLFVMVLTEAVASHLQNSQQKQLKRHIFANVSKQRARHFVMGHINHSRRIKLEMKPQV